MSKAYLALLTLFVVILFSGSVAPFAHDNELGNELGNSPPVVPDSLVEPPELCPPCPPCAGLPDEDALRKAREAIEAAEQAEGAEPPPSGD